MSRVERALVALLVGCAGRSGETDTGDPTAVRPLASAVVVGEGGAALAAGDVDGDGAPEPVVGDPVANRACAGAACLDGPEAGDLAGASLASGHDLDGDGGTDLLVGGPGSDLGAFDAGAAWLVLGPVAAGSLADAHATFVGATGLDAVGSTVAIGDLSGDGAADAILGAPGNDEGGAEAGAVYVFHGPIEAGEHAVANADTILRGSGGQRHGSSGIGDAVATSLAVVRDVDGDGTDDLLVSAGGSDLGAPNGGRVGLLLGPLPTGALPFADADVVLVGEREGAFAGEPVADAGDVDGDGRPDLAIGENASAPERVYVFFGVPGGATVPLVDADVTLEGTGRDAAGWSLAGLGDTNGDGADDLAVGAPLGDGDVPYAGVVYVVLGPLAPGAYDLTAAPVRIAGTEAGNNAGRAVAAAGDPDGDGRADLLVGAPYADGNGRAWLIRADW